MTEMMPYDEWLESALRGVLRNALRYVENKGIPYKNSISITFRTSSSSGVKMAEWLREQHRSTMTIIIGHEYDFWDLRVADDEFTVSMMFSKMPERISVPFADVLSFSDAGIGLVFQLRGGMVSDADAGPADSKDRSREAGGPEAPEKSESQVIALDSFRKK